MRNILTIRKEIDLPFDEVDVCLSNKKINNIMDKELSKTLKEELKQKLDTSKIIDRNFYIYYGYESMKLKFIIKYKLEE